MEGKNHITILNKLSFIKMMTRRIEHECGRADIATAITDAVDAIHAELPREIVIPND